MKDAEFVSKLILLMDDNYFSRIISLSLNRGVIVPGFSIKKSGRNKIPKAIIINTLNLTNKKGKHNYEIIFESIIELNKDNQNQDISLLACKWKNNEQEHNEIEKILIEMISEKTLKTNENSDFSAKADKNNSIIQLNNDINLIKKELEEQKEKNKIYKEKLQKQKIEISNLNQCLLKKEKECNKLKDENQILNNKLVAQNEEYNKKNKQYEIEIDDNKKQIIKLQVIIEELEKFKKSAPKILCITKNKDSFEISGYNIEYLSHIDEELENIYEHGNYSQVWYIKKGFQHGDLIMVKRIISEEKLILARDLNDMISKVKGESK